MDKPTDDAKRILVKTRTHLVPGDDYHDRCQRMRNIICQHHWKRDFNPPEDRWYASGTNFGYDNRRCYFLIDHGESTDEVTVLWYQWTGKELKTINQPLPGEIKSELENYPFVPKARSASRVHRVTKPPQREFIYARLRDGMKIPNGDIEYLKEFPDEVAWLGKKLGPKLLLQLQDALCRDVTSY